MKATLELALTISHGAALQPTDQCTMSPSSAYIRQFEGHIGAASSKVCVE